VLTARSLTGHRLRTAGPHDIRVRRKPAFWSGLGAAAIVAAGLATWQTWPGGGKTAVPHARQYLDASACLLAGPGGIGPDGPARPVWRAMQQASARSRVMATWLPATSPADVPVMLATLSERHCGVIVAAGIDARQAERAAAADPRQSYLLITAAVAPSQRPANLTVASMAAGPAQAARAVTALAAGTPPPAA
jgi:hypothetical protein